MKATKSNSMTDAANILANWKEAEANAPQNGALRETATAVAARAGSPKVKQLTDKYVGKVFMGTFAGQLTVNGIEVPAGTHCMVIKENLTHYVVATIMVPGVPYNVEVEKEYILTPGEVRTTNAVSKPARVKKLSMKSDAQIAHDMALETIARQVARIGEDGEIVKVEYVNKAGETKLKPVYDYVMTAGQITDVPMYLDALCAVLTDYMALYKESGNVRYIALALENYSPFIRARKAVIAANPTLEDL